MKNFISPYETTFGSIDDLADVTVRINLSKGYEKGGFPLYTDTREMLVSVTDSHMGVSGATGSKKTRSVLLPTIFNIAGGREKQSMIIHDTKGDVAEYTYSYLKKQGYKVIILNFRDTLKSDHYNPFDPIVELEKSGEYEKAAVKLEDIGKQIVGSKLEGSEDQYWPETTESFHAGLYRCLSLLTKHDKKCVNYTNMISLYDFLKSDRDNRADVYKKLRELGALDIINDLNSVYNNARETACNIETMINNAFKSLRSASKMMSKSDFTVRDLIDKPTCIFIITPDESSKYNFLVSMFIKHLYGELIDAASEFPRASLPRTVYFLIDEFGSLPKIDDFGLMIANARSRNIRFLLIYQTFSQLAHIYGALEAENFLNNIETLACFRSNDFKLEDMLRRLVGCRNLLHSNREIDVIPSGTLRTRKKGEAVILTQGVKNPLMVYYPDITEHPFLYKQSGCLERKRKSDIRLVDWEKMFNPEKEPEVRDNSYSAMLTEFKNREIFLEDMCTERPYPVLITKNVRHIEKGSNDIVVKRIRFGKERLFMEALENISHAPRDIILKCTSELAILESPLGLITNNDLLIRSYNKVQFLNTLKAISGLCEFITFDPGKR